MIYEFRCRSCGRRFEVHATLKEKEAGLSPQCPRCGSAEVSRVFTPVLFVRRGDGGSSGEAGAGDLDAGPGGEAGDAFDGGFGDGGDGGGWDEGGPDESEWLDGDGEGLEENGLGGGPGGDPGAFGEAADGVDDDPGELEAERG